MKRILLLGIVLLVILTSSAYAQMPGDDCVVGKVDASVAYDGTAHVKMIYRFTCSGTIDYTGQVTKMLISLPLNDVKNVEVEDGLGSMKVLEGPEYVKVEKDSDESKIGIIFRKGLLINRETNDYDIAIEFDTDSLVTEGESVNSISSGVLVANPKVTIITSGMTETVLPVNAFDFALKLDEEASIQSVKPSVCAIEGGDVECADLSKQEMEQLEISWTGGSTGWGGKIQGFTKKYLPAAGDFLGSLFGNIKDMLDK
ncbi:MAG: hypothetical protein ABIG20_05085 [archaeon]